MKPITADWVAKAEGDYATALRENEAKPSPNYDAAVFHSQQCAEKYLKAVLVEASQDFPKTHDLSVILDLCLSVEPTWESLREDLHSLTDIGVEVRYPGISADDEDAGKSIATATEARALVRRSLDLPA